jgi:uncharacterized membrane protein
MGPISPQVLVFYVEAIVAPFYAYRWYSQSTGSNIRSQLNLSGINYLLIPGVIAYASYYLILLAYQYGGEVAAVTSVRQASIPVSVALGGLFLREGAMARRFFAAGLLAIGIILIAVNG